MLAGEHGPAAQMAMSISRAWPRSMAPRQAHGHLRRAHRQHDLHWRRRARVRRAAGRLGRAGCGVPTDAQRERSRRAPLAGMGRPASGPKRRTGRWSPIRAWAASHLDLRALSERVEAATSASRSPGASRMPSSSPIRSWARAPSVIPICSIFAAPSPAGCRRLGSTDGESGGQRPPRLVGIPPERPEPMIRSTPCFGPPDGQAAGDQFPVIECLDGDAGEDQLKALAAAGASSGTVALFHIVGVTPEAPTLDAACQGRVPEQVIVAIAGPTCPQRVRDLTTAADAAFNMVVLVALTSRWLSLPNFRPARRAGVATRTSRFPSPPVGPWPCWPSGGPSRCRASRWWRTDRRHLSGDAHAAAGSKVAHDQFGQVRLLFARLARHGGHLRQPGGLRALGRSGSRHAG